MGFCVFFFSCQQFFSHFYCWNEKDDRENFLKKKLAWLSGNRAETSQGLVEWWLEHCVSSGRRIIVQPPGGSEGTEQGWATWEKQPREEIAFLDAEAGENIHRKDTWVDKESVSAPRLHLSAPHNIMPVGVQAQASRSLLHGASHSLESILTGAI